MFLTISCCCTPETNIYVSQLYIYAHTYIYEKHIFIVQNLKTVRRYKENKKCS